MPALWRTKGVQAESWTAFAVARAQRMGSQFLHQCLLRMARLLVDLYLLVGTGKLCWRGRRRRVTGSTAAGIRGPLFLPAVDAVARTHLLGFSIDTLLLCMAGFQPVYLCELQLLVGTAKLCWKGSRRRVTASIAAGIRGPLFR